MARNHLYQEWNKKRIPFKSHESEQVSDGNLE
jgi:hypothetical protein